MTDKIYKWHGGSVAIDWYEAEDECLRLTGEQAADEKDAVDRLSRHFGSAPKVEYDEGPTPHYDGDYFEGGHNDD